MSPCASRGWYPHFAQAAHRPVHQPQQQRQRRAGIVGILTVGPRGADQLVDCSRGEPADAEVVELTVGGDHRDVGLLVPRHQGGEQPGVFVEAGIQRGLVGHGQRPAEPKPHHRALLVRHQVEVDVEVGDVATAVHGAAERDEAPTADVLRVDPHRPEGVVFVDVDQQHVTGVGFDVVVVGDLG